MHAPNGIIFKRVSGESEVNIILQVPPEKEIKTRTDKVKWDLCETCVRDAFKPINYWIYTMQSFIYDIQVGHS